MILVDTSIWIDHLNHGDATMRQLLAADAVVMHAFVVGELSLGTLKQRDKIVAQLGLLPFVTKADDNEVIALVGRKQLYGLGIGFVDAHLLASCLLTSGAFLWTRDRRLSAAAERLGLDASTE